MRKGIIFRFFVTFFVFFGFCQLSIADDGVTKDSIKIGCSNSFSGPLAFVGTEVTKYGIDTYCKYINDQGGIYGRKIYTVYYDDGYKPQNALANTRRLVERDKVFTIICPEGTAPTMAVLPYLTERKVPLLFPYAGAHQLAGKKYVFTANTLYNRESTILVKYFVKEKNFKKIGILYQDDEYGKTYLRQFKKDFAAMNMQLTAEPVKRGSQDISPQIARLKMANPEVVFLALTPGLGGKALKERHKIGWSEVKFVSCGPLTDEKFIILAEGAGEGVMGLSLWPDPVHSTSPAMVKYRERLEKYNPGHQPNRYNLFGYFYTMLFAEAVKRTGENLTRERLINALESIKGWDSGILSPISYSASDHITQDDGFLVKVEKGRFVKVTDWIKAD